MDELKRAADLIEHALRDGQCAYRIADDDDVHEIRAEIRRLGRARHIRLRTGVIDDQVLAVILKDAPLWTSSTVEMRAKLTPHN